MSLEARKSRWKEYLQLKQLPFYSKEQQKRFNFLLKQHKIDNHYAYNLDIQRGNQNEE